MSLLRLGGPGPDPGRARVSLLSAMRPSRGLQARRRRAQAARAVEGVRMTASRPIVVAVGDAIVDVATSPLREVPRGDAQLEVPEVGLFAGGNATNFALQAAALRARIRFVGCVGADPFGEFLRRTYKAAGVSAVLRVDSTFATGTTTAIARSDGSRVLITAPGANGSLRESDLDRIGFADADHVHRAGFWWTSRLMGRPTARLLARARKAGATTSLDVATDPRGWSRDRVGLVRTCLPHVTTFFGNEAEMKAVAGLPDPIRAAKAVCRLGAEEVVLHRGARGAAWIRGADVVSSRSFATRPDNPTGCGDVFNAAFVVARLRGSDVPDALRFSNACAALHLRDRRRPYPSASDVDRLTRRAPRGQRGQVAVGPVTETWAVSRVSASRAGRIPRGRLRPRRARPPRRG